MNAVLRMNPAETMVRVLVIKPSSLGDIIHSAEGVERLARAVPDCELTWLVNAGFEEFVREFPGVDHVVAFPRGRFRLRGFPGWLPEFGRWLRDLRRGRFDLAVDLQGLQRSGIFARVSGAKERFGPAEARELAPVHYNRRVRVPDEVAHAIDRVNGLIDEVLARSKFVPDHARSPKSRDETAAFRLPIPDAAREKARELLGERNGDDRTPLALCPGARWESKLWTPRRWADLLALLSAQRPDLRPVFLGAPGEEPLVEAIDAEREAADATEPLESLVGRAPIWASAALMERSAAVVCMDSAPLHLAVAVGVPTVSFFGPTEPLKVGPRDDAEVSHRVLRRDLECLSCYKRTCPLEARVCVPETSADEVLEALGEVVRSARATPEPDEVER